MSTRTPADILQIAIAGPRSHTTGAPLRIRVTLRNRSEKTVHLLTRGTHLWQQITDIFVVSRGGERVRFTGPRYKLGDPTDSEYTALGPGEQSSRIIDLSSSYAIDRPGVYRVQLKSAAHDHFIAPSGHPIVARPGLHHRPHALRSNALLVRSRPRGASARDEQKLGQESSPAASSESTPSQSTSFALPARPPSAKAPKFSGDPSASLQTKTAQAHQAALVYVWACLASLEAGDPVETALYKKWFGTSTTTRLTAVQSAFQKIYEALESTEITYDFSQQTDPSYAHVNSSTPGIVYLHSLYVSAPWSGQDSMIGTIIHELSHSYASTADTNAAGEKVYGRSSCEALATSDPDRAVAHADNYEYFAETTLPMNYGVDAAVTLPNDCSYLFLGNIYIRYSDEDCVTVDSGYPLPIEGRWGDTPLSFNRGLGAFGYVEYDGALKPAAVDLSGTHCAIFSDEDGTSTYEKGGTNTLDAASYFSVSPVVAAVKGKTGTTYAFTASGYTRNADGNTGDLNAGWGIEDTPDAALTCNNGHTYLFAGRRYYRFTSSSDSAPANGSDGSPIAGFWGSPPDNS